MQRGGYEALQGEIEITLAQLRAELLDLARVWRHDQLFALGGTRYWRCGFSVERYIVRRFSTAGLFQSP
ncbi:hypothetical protein [Bradyrhizobium sp. LMTR 3]|uniref:hypothetical protein n=1 Tax=Bradyrhizobium sp. LMTR 3 TaxID=189873 RepID=UPI000810A829|nr:hypothetical protein [Bradyrhizobium sp. LMTR 3]OCK53837.1 hypothetical protein LMTR3_21715 [Bradyrhizobium sp. LMTR 3]